MLGRKTHHIICHLLQLIINECFTFILTINNYFGKQHNESERYKLYVSFRLYQVPFSNLIKMINYCIMYIVDEE